MTIVKCVFHLRNVTPGAVRYEQATQDGAPCNLKDSNAQLVGTLYLRKAQLPAGQPPEVLTVSIEY